LLRSLTADIVAPCLYTAQMAVFNPICARGPEYDERHLDKCPGIFRVAVSRVFLVFVAASAMLDLICYSWRQSRRWA